MMVSTVERFVGKSIRQHHETLSGTWWRTKGPQWWLSIELPDPLRIEHPYGQPMLEYHWLLTERGGESWSGYATSVRECEQAAERCLQVQTKAYKGPCCVCGSSGRYRRVVYSPARAVVVCERHRSVCRDHLKDPCEECDVR